MRERRGRSVWKWMLGGALLLVWLSGAASGLTDEEVAIPPNDTGERLSPGTWNVGRQVPPEIRPAAPRFAEQLFNGAGSVDHNVLESLVKLGPEARPAVPALIRALDVAAAQRDSESGHKIAQLFATLAPQSEDAFLSVLRAMTVDDWSDVKPFVEALTKIRPVPEDSYPLLASAFESERPELRYAAIRILSSIGPDASRRIPRLMTELSEEGQEATDDNIGAFLDRHAIDTLIVMLDVDWCIVPHYACQALRAIGSSATPAIPVLLNHIDLTSRECVCRDAVETLAALGEAAVPPLVEFLTEDNSLRQQRVAHALVEMAPKKDFVIGVFMEALKTDRGSYLVHSVADVLAAKGPDAIPEALELIGSDRPSLCCAGTLAFEMLGSDAATAADALVPLLADENKRDNVAQALASIGEAALNVVVAELENADVSMRAALAEVIRRMGPNARLAAPVLANIMEDEQASSYADEVSRALTATGVEAIPTLVDMLSSKHESARQCAYEALSQFGERATPAIDALRQNVLEGREPGMSILTLVSIGKPAEATLLEFVDHEDPFIQHNAWQSACALLDYEAIPFLVERLKEDRYRAAYALARLRYVALPALLDAARDTDCLTRRNAVFSISCIVERGDGNTVEALVAALHDDDVAVRAAAVRALAATGEKSIIPEIENALAREGADVGMQRIIGEALFWLKYDYDGNHEPALPANRVVNVEIPCDQGNDTRTGAQKCYEYSLFFPETLQRFFLARGRKYSETVPTGRAFAYEENSFQLSWAVPGSVLQATWSAQRNGSGRYSVGSVLLLRNDGGKWCEFFRDTPERDSNDGAASQNEADLRFEFCREHNELEMWFHRRTISITEEDGLLRFPSEVWDDGKRRYIEDYDRFLQWPCTLTDERVICRQGNEVVNLGEAEFPIDELVEFVHRDTVTRTSLERLNPMLRGSSICTGAILLEMNVPPYKPDVVHGS